MLKYKNIIFLSGLSALTLGCHVQDVPECLTNAERCDIQAEMGSAVYYVCSEHNTWQPVMGCLSCDGRRCADVPDFIECSDEEDAMCVESGAVALSLACNDNLWIPSVCAQGCKDGRCTGKDKPCENGEKSCYSLGDFGASVQSVCENEHWTSWFCPEGAGCDGNVCEDITRQTKSCDSGFADCNDNPKDGCETELSSKNLETCTACKTGYENCDNDLANGCEVELSSKNLETCTECKIGYGDCDDDLANGCEIELSSKNLETCTECKIGYGNCDNDLTNGCEVELSFKNLETCTECKIGYGNCDNDLTNGCEIELLSKNLETCTECKTGYENCDNDLTNGCEIELSSKNLETCTECKIGYGNCDNDLTNGCEIDLSSKNLATCTECKTGYGNCDNDLTNGCEIDLSSKNLATCTECKTGYGNCDNNLTNGCEVDLVSAGLVSCGGCAENQCYVNNTCKDAKTTAEACGSGCINCTQQEHVSTAKCDNGTCVPLACETGFDVCDNQCIDLNEDNNNCGGCGNKCDTDHNIICVHGECKKTQVYCTPGSADVKSFTVETSSGFKTVQAVAIHNLSDLKCFSERLNMGIGYHNSDDNAYYLTDDIALPSNPDDWIPIENFNGIFIGNGKTIYGTLKRSLFKTLSGATITDLKLDIDRVISNVNDGSNEGWFKIGGLAATSQNSKFYDITGALSISNDGIGAFVGGLIADSERSTYSNISFAVNLVPSRDELWMVGGLISKSKDDTLTHVQVTGGIEGRYEVGGIVGVVDRGFLNLKDSSFSGTINHISKSADVRRCAGGLVGDSGESENTSIESSHSEGEFTAQACAGGIVGSIGGGTMNGNYSSMNVTGTGGVILGGAIGYSTDTVITQCSASGRVQLNAASSSDENTAGGFIGKAGSGTQISESFASGLVHYRGNAGCGGFVGIVGEDTEILHNAAYGTVSGTSILGGFAGAITTSEESTKDTVVSDNMSLACYQGSAVGETGAYFGGFVGEILGIGHDIKLSDNYAFPCYANSYKPANQGGFIFSISNDEDGMVLNINNCYYYDAGGEITDAVYQNDGGISTSGLKVLSLGSDSLLYSTTALTDLLTGNGWTGMECTLPGMGSTKYRIPVCHTPGNELPKPPYCW